MLTKGPDRILYLKTLDDKTIQNSVLGDSPSLVLITKLKFILRPRPPSVAEAVSPYARPPRYSLNRETSRVLTINARCLPRCLSQLGKFHFRLPAKWFGLGQLATPLSRSFPARTGKDRATPRSQPGSRCFSRKPALALRLLQSPRRNCWSWQPRNGETSRFVS